MLRILAWMLLIPALVLGQTARVVIDSPIAGGSGSYNSPYIINGNTIRWHIEVSGYPEPFETNVHLTGHRSCGTAKDYGEFTLDGINGRQFEFTEVVGKYYIRFHNDSGLLIRPTFYLRVPPVRAYDMPYEYPASNRPPQPIIAIKNQAGGSGSAGDPARVSLNQGGVIQFWMRATDPDGAEDIRYGLKYWAIETEGHHPVYMGPESTQNSMESYAFYPQFDELQEWDTNERPSTDGEYTLHLIVIDQHGAWGEASIKFIMTGESPKPPVNIDTEPPEAPKGLRIIAHVTIDLE